MLAISGEYSSGMIRTTLGGDAAPGHRPGREGGHSSPAWCWPPGPSPSLGSLLAGRLILPGHGFTAAHGFPPLSLGDGPVLRAAAGSVLYLALIALLSLGIATAVRDSAAAIGVVLGLLYLFPIVAAVVTDPTGSATSSRSRR